ncbi:hypothetical protein AVEN_96120-1 [Araneus ventricosus]|uniref:Uncharacterized protein n=1 Tax=Araneus ventricosus TaxID=182803 RepID=A0A4Y2G2K1_ARAVE|nr:hypothetical protein AVEN_96120-1 [Araneus ventricosus]
MNELCSSGKIEDVALMYYVIEGINDRQENKTILYGCKNLFEFKEKLQVYEVIKSDYAKSKGGFDKTKSRYDSNPRFNSFDKLKPKQEHDDRFNSENESANKVKSSGGFERMKYIIILKVVRVNFVLSVVTQLISHDSVYIRIKDLNALNVEPSDLKLQNVKKRILNQK